jgi:hypothetical protein
MLEFKNKFDCKNTGRRNSISEQEFSKWRNTNMYRTTYNDMR